MDSFLFMGDVFVGSSRSSSIGCVFSGCNLRMFLGSGLPTLENPFGRFQGPHLRPKPISMVLHRRLDGPLCPRMKSLVLKKEGCVYNVCYWDRKLDMSRSVRCEIFFCWLEEASMRCDDDDDGDDDDDDDGDEDLFFFCGTLSHSAATSSLLFMGQRESRRHLVSTTFRNKLHYKSANVALDLAVVNPWVSKAEVKFSINSCHPAHYRRRSRPLLLIIQPGQLLPVGYVQSLGPSDHIFGLDPGVLRDEHKGCALMEVSNSDIKRLIRPQPLDPWVHPVMSREVSDNPSKHFELGSVVLVVELNLFTT